MPESIANTDHREATRRGGESWDTYLHEMRSGTPSWRADLRHAVLTHADLTHADLGGAVLARAVLAVGVLAAARPPERLST